MIAATALALARRFWRGATLWCVSPAWPEHARHVAVEFVHPVVVGKRALPAVSIDAADPVVPLRQLVRAGDALLVMSDAADASARDVLRRAKAWGATTIWVGVGSRPAQDLADHVLWIDTTDGTAAYDGRLVVQYHVLWELTHVCLEHPGLLGDDHEEPEVCATCADEGRLGEVIEVGDPGSARVRTARGIETIDASIVEVEPGDLVVIHAGMAIAPVP